MIYVICGPTGSGKTETANKLSDILNAPIINGDAFQIYREMNIGTAKISSDDKYYKRYYLLDVVEPSEDFSVMEYQKLFREKVEELSKDYKDIIVCGGTGLYIKASLYDYVFNEEVSSDTSDLEKMTNEELYELLKQIDPKSTETIHINNRKRVIRAISFMRNSSLKKSEVIESQNHELLYEARFFMINPEREKLYENINARVDKMVELGLIEEVKGLLNKYDLSRTARAAIGYKEVIDFLSNKLDYNDCIELIKKRTRNYAKRQVTFFKNQMPIETFSSGEELITKFKSEVKRDA